jgi:CubicO group peptidase (beta-lactamase class C family)
MLVGDHVRAAGAVGLRRLGAPAPVTTADKYHIGSCTKMMTATLAAILIEDGLLTWETTIEEALGKDRGHRIHRDFREVTITQLLAHVGGFTEQAPAMAWREAWDNQGRKSPPQQRLLFVKALLSQEPAYPPGTKTEYSNQGYAVAGVMLEKLADKPWEELLRERLFEPLDLQSAGFRAPGNPSQLDQPWGHQGDQPIAPDSDKADNPDAIGPAGTVHLSMPDFLKFARLHLQKKPGKVIRQAETFAKLNRTLPNSGTHGVGGWLVHDLDRMGGHCLQMTGSNTMWLTLFWVIPGKDLAIVVSTNSGQANAFATCDQVIAKLMDEFSTADN